MPPQDLASQVAVQKKTTAPEHHQEDPEDMLHDVKLYQDAAIEYCDAYQALERKYSEQAWLMEEASGALTAAEVQTSQKEQQLKELQKKHDADVQLAVSKTTVQHEEQLSSVTQQLQAKDRAMEKLKEQVRALKISLASQTNLPSVAPTKEEVDLHKEVFDFLPGTVNTKRDAATYESRDQPFHFDKQVQFGNRSPVPDLKSGADPKGQTKIGHKVPITSTPFRDGNAVNKIFDISQISPMMSSHQDAVTIAAEVSAASAIQAPGEFCRMREPKITKFKGEYLADAELLFRSWWTDIMSNIQDCELDNKATIQLIKDMTAESTCREVEFQLDFVAVTSYIKTC